MAEFGWFYIHLACLVDCPALALSFRSNIRAEARTISSTAPNGAPPCRSRDKVSSVGPKPTAQTNHSRQPTFNLKLAFISQDTWEKRYAKSSQSFIESSVCCVLSCQLSNVTDARVDLKTG